MAALSADSLFSFEVVVDFVYLPEVRCRFPAAAFKLLDFPTLLVYMVDPDMAESIQRKVAGLNENELPHQFAELKNSSGRFAFKRGKSSLFKMSANTLHESLITSPLYVMLIDTFPKVPKLLGSCLIPLDGLVEGLYDDICKIGLSTPLSAGHKGNFILRNLMGHIIGEASLSYRLMSLGTSLLSHIPDNNLSQPEVESITVPLQKASSDTVVDGTYLTRREEKGTQAFSDTAEDRRITSLGVSVGTETISHKKKKKTHDNILIQKSDAFHMEEDVNSFQPPALFYNSELEGAKASTNEASTYQEYYNEIWDDFSDSDTIRDEDKYSEEDYRVTKPKPQVKQAEDNVLKHAQLETAIKMVRDHRADLQQFPLLTALLDELCVLKQHPLQHPTIAFAAQQPVVSQTAEQSAVAKTPPRQKEQAAKAQERDGGCAHHPATCHRCVKKRELVPRSKSWVAEEQHRPVLKKSKLTCGLTQTQRLRLSRGSKDYLQELDKADHDRREKKRAETLDKYASFSKTRVISKDDQRKTSNGSKAKGGKGKQRLSDSLQSTAIGVQTMELDDTASAFGDLSMSQRAVSPNLDSDIVPEPEVRPIPTPRKSLSKNKYEPTAAPATTEKSKPVVTSQAMQVPPTAASKMHRVASAPAEVKLVSQTTATAAAKSSTNRATAESKPTATAEKQKLTKKESDSSTKATSATTIDDSLGEDPGEMLHLQRFVEQYSDDDDDANGSDAKSQRSSNSKSSGSEHSSPRAAPRLHSKLPQPATSGLNPLTSDLSPIAAAATSSKNAPLAVRQPLAGLGMSSTIDITASLDSTAHIRASDVHSAVSMDAEEMNSSRADDKKPPIPTPRRSVDRQQSVSSVALSETGSAHSPGPDDDRYVSDFESEDLSSPRRNPEILRKIADLKVDPSVKHGYTWSANR